MTQQAIEAAAAASGVVAGIGGKATWAGSLTLVGSWLLSSQAAAVLGLVLGVAGFVVQWVYRHREYRLRLKAHQLRMKQSGFTDEDSE